MKPIPRRLAPLLLLSWLLQSHAQTMTRVTDRNTPAHRAALKFMRGVNLGNYLEYAAGHPAANAFYDSRDFDLIRSEGFDHVRIPVAWHLYAADASGFKLDNSIFAKADALVDAATSRGLAVLIDLHHFDAFTSSPTANTEKFYAIWQQVAQHYANATATVAFELLNEPRDAATTSVMNKIYAEAIRRIRATNPNRTIFVGPGNYNSLDDLSLDNGQGLQLPNSDLNVIATVHSYEPYYFTHQGAEWALPDTATTGVIYPGPPPTPLDPAPGVHDWVITWFKEYNRKPTSFNPSSAFSFRGRLLRAKRWADQWGRPVHLGEFGCYSKSADAVSRANYYREMRAILDEQGLGWALWDWKSGFHYIKNGQPDPPELRDAMFPPIQLRATALGALEFDSAVGKIIVVERATSLTEPITWETLSTQTLAAPKFTFTDPAANQLNGAYYRVKWLK